MTEPLIPTLAMGIAFTLFAFELVVAIVSFLDARQPVPIANRTPLWFTRPSVIRDHMRVRRLRVSALRREYPVLGSPGHGHDVRRAISRLRPLPGPEILATCPTCRWSRRRGLEHCPACGSRLIAPMHAMHATHATLA